MILFSLLVIVVFLFGAAAVMGAPYVPSLKKELQQAFGEVYEVGSGDVVVDLGSGDGRVLLEAKRRGADCVGVELNPLLALISKVRLGSRAKIVVANMWQFKLPAATTLVYVFSVSRDIKKLEQWIQSEAIRLDKELYLMTFGASLPSIKPVKVRNAHSLYAIRPLQVN